MKTNEKQIELQEKLLNLFEECQSDIFSKDHACISEKRIRSINIFKNKGFPTIREEAWKGTNLTNALTKDYQHLSAYDTGNIDLDKLFKCDIHNFDTEILSLLNGWVVNGSSELQVSSNGVIIGSLAEAMKKFPEFFDTYYGQSPKIEEHSLSALNTAITQDGIFIYLPENTELDNALQIVNIISHKEGLFVQNRNLIVLGKNSKLTLVHCDDTINQLPNFNNSVTEVFLDENAKIDYYKLQNFNNESTLINSTYFTQKENSNVSTNAITLNGGLIRNNVYVSLMGERANADVLGVYLMDRKQHVDSQVFIDHAVPNCTSNELFKGILDEEATGVFNGHILVRKNAQHTNAFQNNKNILLTDSASIDTKPFLEIYADDVKCSHGATVGQLDADAMFYLRSRGITENNARMLLMYAFVAEVTNHISIEPLRNRIDDMVKKRLRGELSICENCVLHCSNPEKKIEFDIDTENL
jgi:Fe-S cluster assembly protein SufD